MARLLRRPSIGTLSVFVLWLLASVAFGTGAAVEGQLAKVHGQETPLITLHTFERPLETSFRGVLVPSALDEESVYLMDEITGRIDSYDAGDATADRRVAEPFGPLSAKSRGYAAFVDADSKVVLAERNGKILARLDTPPVTSLAVLSSGAVVVAAPIGNRLLHMYSRTGEWVGSFGRMKRYQRLGGAQSRFLHKGKVLVDLVDNIYYVYNYRPLIQKFTSTGELEWEIEVRGEAVDLQQELAERFLASKKGPSVGGVTVIGCAAINLATGQLWIGLNGSSVTGVVYEYNSAGEKLREYVLETSAPSLPPQPIIGLRDIALTPTWLYTLTNLHQVFRFNRGAKAISITNSRPERVIGEGGYSVRRVSWSPMLRRSSWSQQGCGAAQSWDACGFNCPAPVCNGTTPTPTSSNSATFDCKTPLQDSLSLPYVVVSSSCTQFAPGTQMHMRGGCMASVRICKNGVNTDHSLTMDCLAPNCTGGDGGGCNEAEIQDCINQWTWTWNEETCTCECVESNGCFTPVLIDVRGDGFRLTDADRGVEFDLNGDGIVEKTSWTSPGSDDAWLALDRNGNGSIDDGSELFGNFTEQPPSPNPNGFLALAQFDKPANGGNGDGIIDSRDAVFPSLRLWHDANHNGICESGELRRLESLGLVSIETDHRESRRRDRFGNLFIYRARVNAASDGRIVRWACDVFLVTSLGAGRNVGQPGGRRIAKSGS